MTIDPLVHCHQVVEELAREEAGRLTPEGIDALVRAIWPFVQRTANPTTLTIRTIAHNYNLDGPMVQAMLSQGTADGERLWGDCRRRFVIWAHRRLAPEEAEDLVHDSLLQAAKALRTFKFESRLQTYLWSILVHSYASRLRQKRRVQMLPLEHDVEDGEPEPYVATAEASLEDEVVDRTQNAALKRLVDQEIRKIIKSEDFQILAWYYMDKTYIDEPTGKLSKWTDKAISERLQLPIDTVTSRRLRALRRLKANPTLRQVAERLLNDVESEQG